MSRLIRGAWMLLLLFSGSACDLENLVTGGGAVDPPNVGNINSNAVNFEVLPLDTARFWIEASDPQGETLQYQWRINGGEIIGPGGTAELTWRAPIKGGNYVLSVDVSNSAEKITRSEVVRVPSIVEPRVHILYPEENTYLVQHTGVLIQASAVHENGIQDVQLWLDDVYVPLSPEQSQGVYRFDWKIDATPGPHELKIRAVAQLTGVTGADSVSVFIEGIIAGKK